MLQNPNDFCEIFNARGEISLKTHAAITEGGFTECDRLSPTAIRFDLLSLSLCSAFNMQIGLSHERPNICNKTRSWPNAINMLMWSCFFHYRTPRHWRFSAFFHARSSLPTGFRDSRLAILFFRTEHHTFVHQIGKTLQMAELCKSPRGSK